MGRVPETPLNPDEPNSIAELADNTRREVDGNIEFGSPQDPDDLTSTELPGADAVSDPRHNGTVLNIAGSWASADVTALDTAVTFHHNLYLDNDQYTLPVSGSPNVRAMSFWWQHDGAVNTGNGTVRAEWLRIWDHTVTGSDVATVSTGAILDGNTHKAYQINFLWHAPLAAATQLILRWNNDAVAANYARQVAIESGGATTLFRDSVPTGAFLAGKAAAASQIDGYGRFDVEVTATPASLRGSTNFYSLVTIAGVTTVQVSTVWSNTTSNITSAVFTTVAGTNDIGINSHFEIWAMEEALQNHATVSYNFHTGDDISVNSIDLRFYAGGNRLVDGSHPLRVDLFFVRADQ